MLEEVVVDGPASAAMAAEFILVLVGGTSAVALATIVSTLIPTPSVGVMAVGVVVAHSVVAAVVVSTVVAVVVPARISVAALAGPAAAAALTSAALTQALLSRPEMGGTTVSVRFRSACIALPAICPTP